jgi:flagellar hook-associated protein FlgK
MDLFFGARGGVREIQQFDPVTFAVLAPALAPARLTGQAVPTGLTGHLAADTYTINGVAMDALTATGPLSANDLADWINNNSQPTGVLATVQDGALVLERPTGNTTDDIRVGLGSLGQPSDLTKIGFTPALHVRGVAPDDLLVFVTNRSGASGEVALSAQYATIGGDVKQALRASPLAVRFTENNAYEIVDVQTDTVLAERAFDPTNPNATISYRGLTLSFSSAPKKGDLFTIDGNRDGIGNNEAMLALTELEKKALMPGGLTITEAYIERVSQVGNVARQAAISQQALTVVYEQAREARDGVSGVSLDQEAAELVRFQQAYQANAKVMQVASQLFDAILQVN